MFSWFKSARRRRLLAVAFPAEWLTIVQRNVRQYGLLPPQLQATLRGCTRIIVAEREWVPCRGLQLTDEMRVTVAAQASLLLLGNEGYYFDRVPSILLYPTPYRRQHSRGQSGIVEDEIGILGESWHRGSIVLSWPSVLESCRSPRDGNAGNNLVLHEFAHHLDGLDGAIEGNPPLPSRTAHAEWEQVFAAEYDRLQDDLSDGRHTLLDPYGAESKAEFFAVATECFFERSAEMRARHKDLYRIFANFYRVDPAAWSGRELNEASTAPLVPKLRLGTPTVRSSASADKEAELPEERYQAEPGSEIDDADLRPEDLPALRTADDYFTRGHDYYYDGLFELAEADFSSALRLRPDDQEALIYRAQTRLALGHSEAALADARQACELDAGDLDARRVRGMALVEAEQFSAAVPDLDLTIDKHPADLDALFYRGLAWIGLKKFGRGLADFNSLLERDPSDAEAYLQRSRCHEMLGDRTAAERDLRRAEALELENEVNEGRP